jgi:hypothetical protein
VDDLLQAARVDVFEGVLVDVLTDVAFEDAVVDVFVGIIVDVLGIVFVEVVIDDLIDVSFGSVLLELPVMILGLVGVILIGVLEGKPNKIKNRNILTFALNYLFSNRKKTKKNKTLQRLLLLFIIYFQTV